MRWTYFRLTGYVGIMDGLGLDTIEIPFYKCINDICLIVGKNGSGKSTILSSLSPMPDNSAMYCMNRNAEKEGGLILPDGTEYHFLISSAVDGKGGRKPTKAFIQKNGVELNSNGNISSYKEIVEAEFDMDPNFMSLTMLASDNRGLADKKPAERKKYVAYNIDKLDTYNNMNKVLSKKSSIFRSHINSITSKINSIGDPESAKINLAAMESRITGLESYIAESQMELAKCQSMINSLDRDGKIQETYTAIANSVDAINNELDRLVGNINRELDRMHIKDEASVDIEIDQCRKAMDSTRISMEDAKMKISNLISESEDISRSIELKRQRYDALSVETDYDSFMEQLSKYEKIVSDQEAILKQVGLYGVEVSKEEYIMIFEKMKWFRDVSFTIMDCDDEVLRLAVQYARSNMYKSDLEMASNKLSEAESDATIFRASIEEYKQLLPSVEILKNRPSECSIDTCPFIAKALQDAARMPEKHIEEIGSKLDRTEKHIEELDANVKTLEFVGVILYQINGVLDDAQASKPLIQKFAQSNIFLNREEYLRRLENHNQFNEVADCASYIQMANSIDGYNTNKSILSDLYAQKKILDSKVSIMEEIAQDISVLRSKLSDAEKQITENNNSIAFNSGLLRELEDRLSKLQAISESLVGMKEKAAEKADLKRQFLDIKQSIADIKEYLDKSNMIRSNIDKSVAELNPIKKDRDQLNYAIMRAQEYEEELRMYQEKFNTIEVLKKYCSPSSGIQTLYMSMYMNKTMTMANELLQYMFEGYLELMPYVINSDEFRIPVKHGNGMISDDISSCSTAQICMISMVITIALSLQSSQVFDVFRFDEIDGGLDTSNRSYFFDTIHRMIRELGIQQIVMISHAIESNMRGVDLIKLAIPKNSDIDYSGANIIYDYRS